MKRILFTIVMVSVLGISSIAQDANVGLKIGLNWSNWYGEDIENLPTLDGNIDKILDGEKSSVDNMFLFGKLSEDGEYMYVDGKLENRMGMHAGFQINSEINDYFWLKHEFLFSTKGFSFTGTKHLRGVDEATGDTVWQEEANTELRYRSYHVDIFPVSLAAHYEGLQLFVGPMVSVMLASNWIEKSNSLVTTPGTQDFGYISKVNSVEPVSSDRTLGIIDYGFVAGFEYELPFGLNAGIRYVQGFASVLETPEGEARTNAFNKDIRISLGYTFGKED